MVGEMITVSANCAEMAYRAGEHIIKDKILINACVHRTGRRLRNNCQSEGANQEVLHRPMKEDPT